MDFLNLTIYILLLVLGISLYTLKSKERKHKRDDYMLKSFNIEIYFGIIVLIVCGILGITKECYNFFN